MGNEDAGMLPGMFPLQQQLIVARPLPQPLESRLREWGSDNVDNLAHVEITESKTTAIAESEAVVASRRQAMVSAAGGKGSWQRSKLGNGSGRRWSEPFVREGEMLTQEREKRAAGMRTWRQDHDQVCVCAYRRARASERKTTAELSLI